MSREPRCAPELGRGTCRCAALHSKRPPSLSPPPASPHRVDHWAFYEQARRVLKPTGACVIWCARAAHAVRAPLCLPPALLIALGSPVSPLALSCCCRRGYDLQDFVPSEGRDAERVAQANALMRAYTYGCARLLSLGCTAWAASPASACCWLAVPATPRRHPTPTLLYPCRSCSVMGPFWDERRVFIDR